MLTGYHQKNKEKLSKKARERYQNLLEEKKGNIHQYACEQYINLSEEEKITSQNKNILNFYFID